MTKKDYRESKAVNWSTLKHLLDSPHAYVHACDTPLQPTPAMAYGTAVHTQLLEPARYSLDVSVAPPECLTPSGALSTAKPAREWMQTLPEGQCVITPEQDAAIITTLSRLPTAWQHIARQVPYREEPMWWQEPDFNANCKGMPDAHGPGYLLDVKTWAPRGRFNPAAFMREAVQRRYLGQLGFYARGLEKLNNRCTRWMFLVVQSVAPYESFLMELEPDAIEYGQREAAEALASYGWWQAAGRPLQNWPEVVTEGLPAYLRKKDEDADDGAELEGL